MLSCFLTTLHVRGPAPVPATTSVGLRRSTLSDYSDHGPLTAVSGTYCASRASTGQPHDQYPHTSVRCKTLGVYGISPPQRTHRRTEGQSTTTWPHNCAAAPGYHTQRDDSSCVSKSNQNYPSLIPVYRKCFAECLILSETRISTTNYCSRQHRSRRENKKRERRQ